MTATNLKRDLAKIKGVKVFTENQNNNIIVSIAQLHYGIEHGVNGNFVKDIGCVVLLSIKNN